MSKKLSHILTRDFLHKEFVTKQKSAQEIASELKVSVATVHNYINKFGIFRRRQYDNIVGKQFGSWTVKDLAESNEHGTIWLCECTCGGVHKIHRHSLTQSKSTQCKPCADKARVSQEEFPQAFFTKIVLDAKRRNLSLDITRDYIYNLFVAQNRMCALSGLPISFAQRNWDHFHGGSTASLDRIDSSIGYIKGNVQWVHKDINRMKQTFSQEYFGELCNLVVEHKEKSRAGSSEVSKIG